MTEDDIKYYIECGAGSNGNNANKKLPYGSKDKFVEDDLESDNDPPLDISSIDDDDFIEPFDINTLFD